MAHLQNLPNQEALLDLFRQYPQMARPQLQLFEVVMRADSSLSVGQRELIAGYVSGLNACAYCHGIHAIAAESFGAEQGVLDALLVSVDAAPIEERLKPLLHYARKPSHLPSRLTRADAEAVYAAGWDDQALFAVVSVCALFNFMNRLVEGIGLDMTPDYCRVSGQRLHDRGYQGLAKLLDE